MKPDWFILLFLTCCCCTRLIALSQRASIWFEYLYTVDGLSNDHVTCMLQDKQSYLWFATEYGLNRYDGSRFWIFKNIPGDSTTLAHNMIMRLYEDARGLIWVGRPNLSSRKYSVNDF